MSKEKPTKDEIIAASSNCHAFNIIGFVEDVAGKIKHATTAQANIQAYLIRYFSDSVNMSGTKRVEIKPLESFKDWCSRVREENPNAPWEDETVESMYEAYKLEKTGL